MKQAQAVLAATVLSLTLVSNAQADRGHHDRHDGWNTPSRQMSHHHDHRPARNHWLGPAAVLALGGLTLGAIAYSNAPASPVVYSAPPPPPAGSWYFCRSSGQYYPYTQACPEGWLAVAPR